MRWHLILFSIVLSGIAAVASQAQDLNESLVLLKIEAYRSYYGKGRPVDYPRALELYQQAAEQGDAEAQYIVGGMLYQGQGTDPDKRKGFKWLLMAAEHGKVSAESLNIIGSMYLRGANVPQNYLEAKKWLTQAAKLGNASAQNDLAYLFYNGLGGERNYKKALELYEKAAFQGDIMAQANVGLMYATGTGTETDKARGYAWYSLAASRGNTLAATYRNNLMLDMNWEELNRAQALSLEFYRRVEKMAEPKTIAPPPLQE